MTKIRNQAGYERLAVLVDEILVVTVQEQGSGWLNGDAADPNERPKLLEEMRQMIREIRRTEPENAGVSARRRWIEVAFDSGVQRLRVKHGVGTDKISGTE